MEVDLDAVGVEAHDGVGEAPLLVVLDSPAAEGPKDAKKKKRSNEQSGKESLARTGKEAGGGVRIHSFAQVLCYFIQGDYFKPAAVQVKRKCHNPLKINGL